jgi:hypothetical protein
MCGRCCCRHEAIRQFEDVARKGRSQGPEPQFPYESPRNVSNVVLEYSGRVESQSRPHRYEIGRNHAAAAFRIAFM